MTVKNRYLWLGSYQSKELFEKMLSRNIGQASGYASQKGLVKGFDALLDGVAVLDTIGVISYPAYPVYPKRFADREEWKRTPDSRDVCVGYLNLKYLNYLTRSKALIKEVKLWAKTRVGTENNIVIIYEPSAAKLKAAMYLKKKFGAKVFVIIPDVPEFVNLGANKLVRFAKKLDAKKQRKLFNDVDGFICYSSKMADYYGFPDGKWILMEGVFDNDEANILAPGEKETDGTVRIMYCGALDEFRGIPALLDAFDELRDGSYELWLTGAGRSDNLIKERIKTDSRIRHFGYLDSREEVLKLQQQADILIHTRDVTSPAAPYCFPSKLFEYLASAKPVASVRVPGIPEEYFDYMTPIEEMTKEGIKAAILEVINKDSEEKKNTGRLAREFVLTKKNSREQAKKILDFIAKA